jgi:hypothetical protein
MILKIENAQNKENKETLRIIANLWMLKVYEIDEFVDEKNQGLIETLMMDLC